jgi:hypothetical protein
MTILLSLNASLRLDPGVFQVMRFSPHGLSYALMTLCLAGLSYELGHSVILLANRVKGKRFALSIVLGLGLYLLNIMIWSLLVWLLGAWLFHSEVSFRQVLIVLGLAQAPQLFGVLSLVPFFGPGLGRLCSLWTLLASLVGIQVVFGLPFWLALVPGGLSWFLLQLLQRSLGYPLATVAQRMKGRLAGTELPKAIDTKHLLEQLETNQRSFKEAV